MTPWVLRLLILNVAVFLLSALLPGVVERFAFVPFLVLARPWTLITYMFLHGGLWHLVFNMLSLVFFGPRLELELGGRDFLLLYFISGISGALLSFVTPMVGVIGASGAVFGVLLGFARYWPREMIMIWGIVPVQARWLVVIMTALSLLGGFSGGDNIAHFAHLGGFAGGFLFLTVRDRNTRSARFRARMAVPPPSAADMNRWASIDRTRLHEVNREELDRIMAKIAEKGIGSLTNEEHAFLNRFSPE